MKKPFPFTSQKERRLWMWAFLTMLAIFATLFLGGRVIDFMVNKRIIEQSTFYLFLLLVFAFILSGFKNLNRRYEYWIYAGALAVFAMAVLRMGLSVSERSHMVEYGLLAILIYKALMERKKQDDAVTYPFLFAIVITGMIGTIDECIQYFLPYRVFDFFDIGFNFFAAFLGVFISFGTHKATHFIEKLRTKK
ncbi:VanZ like family protein [Robiginitalea myxolifaciens]|uniref:VanZ like family protein n=1 Tax=Robiginitalea myxolifaciens TaxID=400055 RepID=A0A1I6HBX0_9FLAO|nr:VanZ family protein [Robiginitalea myxolifaciens]SFR51884.1 VanZ like family protein [Robiginitalea myxolifaciens]